ncbi:MAG: pyridoxine 5'-phosphate synthase [Deltaproteobacteria bacterium]|nr:pyridoxine 5'-phosphate synthase [Deltaproteobacteria bacterium]
MSASLRRLRLGVNVDHVATIRQNRGTRYPDPVLAASLAELAGADQITVHLREDRRHIQERDLAVLRQTVQVPLNLEMAATPTMLALALQYLPDTVTLVPEKREERTTEGGLDVAGQRQHLGDTIAALREHGITVSLFIDPAPDQVRASAELRATTIELHTGDFCEADTPLLAQERLDHLRHAAQLGHDLGLQVAAGHGLDYRNVKAVAGLPFVDELNIGHAIVARALFVGIERAVREMIEAMHTPEPPQPSR